MEKEITMKKTVTLSKRFFLLVSVLFMIDASSSYANEVFMVDIPYKSQNDSMFYYPSMFHGGDMTIGVGYATNWGGGLDLLASYFLYDDVAMQIEYASLSYKWGWDTTTISYVDVAGVYHRTWGQTLNGWDFGWFAGIGLATAKATSIYPGHNYSTSADLGGLFWVVGLEMKFIRHVKAHIGVGSLSLGAGLDFSF